jgi:glycosyltransferase involved in cell wall biosynthesis
MEKQIKYLKEKLGLFLRGKNKRSLKELIAHIKYRGLKNLIYAFLNKKNILNSKLNYYHSWFINTHSPSLSDLASQKIYKFDYEPLISIIVPTYNTPKQFLIDMIESVISQTYSKWELCIADGASISNDTLEVLRHYSLKDSRIKVLFLIENFHISGNTNQALTIASGEYMGFFDHDDLLTPNCVFEYVNAINKNNKPALLYCDEDKVSSNSKFFSNPTFKPDFALDTLRTNNYICHWLVIRRDILDKAGEFDSKCDGAQDYDMVLRVVDIAQDIIHIPKVLYHWRIHSLSTASGLGNTKPYTHEAGLWALTKHLERNCLPGKVRDGININTYKIDYELISLPLISIIISISSEIANLYNCIDSITKKTTYSNYEIILVQPSSSSLNIDLNKLQKKYPQSKIYLYKSNLTKISVINNLGISHAKGEYLTFLDSNAKILTSNWLEEMLMLAQRKDVGAVGAKLYHPNNSLCSGGIILGFGQLGIGVVAYHNAPKLYRGYGNILYNVHNVSAITLNGMMIEKRKINKLAGFDENYASAFLDIDLCIRLRKAEYLIVWTPFVRIVCHSIIHLNYSFQNSAGNSDFKSDLSIFATKYNTPLNDPYYNINLSRSEKAYSLDISSYKKYVL